MTVLVLALGTFLWSQTPKVKDPQFVEDVLRSSQERFQELQAKASSADKNAYLDKTFQAVWGSGAARKGGTPAESALNDWVQAAGGGESFDHAAALSKEDGEYLAAREKFLEYYPSLSRAVEKECFAVPTATLDLSTEVPDYLKVRDCAQSLVLLSQSFLAEGRKEEALRAMEQAFRFARLQEGQTMIGELVATAMREKAAEALVRDEAFRKELTTEDWARLRAEWTPKRTARERFYQVMEMETAAMIKTIDDTIAGNTQAVGSLPRITTQAGFVMEREKRMMLNRLTAELKAAKSGQAIPPLSFTWWDWVMGRSGILSAVATPAYHDILNKLYLEHSRLAGLSVASQLQARLLEDGKLPGLSDLEFGPEFPLGSFELRAGKGELFLKLERERLATTDAMEEPKVGWRTQESDGILFEFRSPE